MIFFVNPSIFVFHLKDLKSKSRTTDNEGINEKKIFGDLGRCGRHRSYLKILECELILGRAVKAISSPGVLNS